MNLLFTRLRMLPMPQLVVLVMLVAVGVIAQRVIAGSLRSRSDQTYRPRGRGWKTPDAPGTTVLMSREQLAGVRDAFTSAPIDATASLKRCCGCQSVYHASSVQTLERENQGRCVTCDARVFEPVMVTD